MAIEISYSEAKRINDWISVDDAVPYCHEDFWGCWKGAKEWLVAPVWRHSTSHTWEMVHVRGQAVDV